MSSRSFEIGHMSILWNILSILVVIGPSVFEYDDGIVQTELPFTNPNRHIHNGHEHYHITMWALTLIILGVENRMSIWISRRESSLEFEGEGRVRKEETEGRKTVRGSTLVRRLNHVNYLDDLIPFYMTQICFNQVDLWKNIKSFNLTLYNCYQPLKWT